MKYVILVSHGKFANGLNDALSMLAGNREDILSVGLENGKSVDEFTALFTEKVKDISNDDDVILLGDIIGGSFRRNEFTISFNNCFDERHCFFRWNSKSSFRTGSYGYARI